MRKTKKKDEPQQLPNHELVVVAAYLVGAQKSTVDTEDIAVKANEIAPGRFSWRKYKEQINIDTVRKRLWDATKPEKGAYLIGSEKLGWRLTKAGFDFARSFSRRGVPKQTNTQRASQTERVVHTREIRRMLTELGFRKIQDGQEAALTKADAERFFRIDDYVSGSARAAKIERFRILASSNNELLRAVELLAALLGEN